MARADLFQDLAIESKLDPSCVRLPQGTVQRNRLVDHLLDDNLSDSTDDQLKRLIYLKFNNDPYVLIRQLFHDLSVKETELILLREEKARRENELLRLCNEYGNLSYVEIDKRLNALDSVKDVHSAVSNLVQEAMASSDNNNSSTNAKPNTRTISKRDRNKDLSSADKTLVIPYRETSPRTQLQQVGDMSHEEERSKEQVGWSHWRHWFNLSDDNLLRSTHATREIEDLNLCPPTYKSKTVVELDNIVDSCSPELPNSQYSTDKFGFLNDRPLSTATPLSYSNASSSTALDHVQPVPNSKIQSSKSSSGTGLISVLSENSLRLSGTGLTQSLDILKHLNTQSIASSEFQLKQWHGLMKKVCSSNNPTSDQDVSPGAFGLKASNLKKQSSTLRKLFGHTDEKLEDSKSFKTLRTLVFEGGIPPKYRNFLWFELSGAKSRAIPGEYQRLIEESTNTSDPKLTENIEQIRLDLHRTLPSNIYFSSRNTKEPGPQISTLNNILMAFVAYKPEIGYCQGMNKLAGNIILGVNESHAQGGAKLNEEYLFWLFVSIVEDILPTYNQFNLFHPEALELIKYDSEQFHRNLKLFLPLLVQHLDSLSIEIEVIVISWWIGAFTEAVSSIDLWLKILDGLLIADDSRIKFHAYTLAALKFYLRSLLDCKAAEGIYNFINQLKSGNGPNIRSNEFMTAAAEFEDQIIASKASGLMN